MRGIHDSSLAQRRVPHGRNHERHFPDRGRAVHFGWNALNAIYVTRRPEAWTSSCYPAWSFLLRLEDKGHLSWRPLSFIDAMSPLGGKADLPVERPDFSVCEGLRMPAPRRW